LKKGYLISDMDVTEYRNEIPSYINSVELALPPLLRESSF